MLTIDLAIPADIDALFALDLAAAAGDVERRAAIAEWVVAGEVHIARRNGRAVGYVALTRSFFRSPFIELLMVAPSERRAGIGSALVEHCIRLTPAGSKLWTSTNQSNTPMQALLPHLGFEKCGMFEHLDPGDPELIYIRWP